MLVTLFGMSTLVSAAQPAKAKSPIVFRPSGSAAAVRLRQLVKACASMVVRLAGNVTAVSP